MLMSHQAQKTVHCIEYLSLHNGVLRITREYWRRPPERH